MSPTARSKEAPAVHFVDEGQARYAAAGAGAIEGLGARLDPRHGADEDDRPVEGMEGAADLGGEVDVPGGIYQVDAIVPRRAREPPLHSKLAAAALIVIPRSRSTAR